MAEELGIDDFLNHGKRGGGEFASWRDDGRITFWLHPRTSIWAVYFHRWFRLDTHEDSKTNGEYRSMRLNCIEDKKVNEKMNFRDRSTGEREHPPQVCPHCLMIEWFYEQITAGKLDWTKPAFRFGDGDGAVTLHAGGLCGLFGKKEISADEKRQLKRNGIRLDEAWLENTKPTLNYIFTIIDDSCPEEGPKIAMEKTTLGRQVQKLIKDRMADFERAKKPRDHGNPMKYPVAIEWTFDEREQFDKKYNSRFITQLEMSEAVEEAMQAEPPDLSRLMAEPDWAQFRLSLEQHALFDMPIDEWFEPLEAKLGKKIIPGSTSDDDDDDEEEDDLDTKSAKYGASKTPKGKPAPPSEDDEMVACDACGKAMHEDLLECPHCGAEYEEVDGEIRLKPKKEPPKRRRAAPKAPEPEDDDDPDDIPF